MEIGTSTGSQTDFISQGYKLSNLDLFLTFLVFLVLRPHKQGL
jgi:hypothetical protein